MVAYSSGPVRRVPIYQIMLHGAPFVCTDDELGRVYTHPFQPAHVWSCLGSLWAGRYQEFMHPAYRWTRPAPEIGPEARHCRLGTHAHPIGASADGYTRDHSELGYYYADDVHTDAADLVTLATMQFAGSSPDAGYYYGNGLHHYAGVGWYTPKPVQPVEARGLRIHAPQVVRVSYDSADRRISMDPEVVTVTRGGGAPIYFLRGNGLSTDRASMEWSFADLVLVEEGVQAPPGQSYPSSALFSVRHMTASEILVIDDIQVREGDPERETKYRLSIQDHRFPSDGRVGAVFSRDPKVRNGSAAGSGEVPSPGGG